MVSKTILHYRILEELGRGGMGVVYKAEDTKLERTVAIKFLPRQIAAGSEERERFKIEAKAAAVLNHPNIATIHSIEEHDEEIFIVMEYIEGKELKDLIKSPGFSNPRELEIAINYATQIAEGLQTAHEKRVIHRDIKSANIMITDKGRVKIMDFGLAKIRGGAQVTKVGTTMGTAAYMSPEQARGEEAGQQADIWSFGVVLYEMLTGKLPFGGDYEQAVMYSILNEESKSPRQLCSDIPINIEKLILKTLEKNKEDRYNNFQELLNELKTPSNEISVEAEIEKSIIVLPFINMSPDPDQDYFSDGLTEEIIADLSQIHDLLVISRSSAMTFKGTKKKIKEIAKEVNVQYVLEGSVRKSENNLRITAQLIDSVKDTHLWAEKYRGTLDDIFEIQEQVSRSIVDALMVKLTHSEEKNIAGRPIQNATAYECYLKARQDIFLFTEQGLDRARQSLENGLKIVGENELLYSGLGYVYFQYVNIGINPDLLPKAEEMANKIFELEPASHYGYKLLGLINYKRGNFQNSAKYFKKTLEKEPNDVDALCWLSAIHLVVGKMAGAKSFAKKLTTVDPLTPTNYCFPMYAYLYANELEAAYHAGRKMYDMDPENTLIRLFFSDTLIWNKKRGGDVNSYAFDKL